MNKNIIKLLDDIEHIENQNEFKDFVYSSCTEQNIKTFNSWIIKELGNLTPDISCFVEFCKVADGFNANGVFMFSIDPDKYVNVYVRNMFWWEAVDSKEYLLLGNDSISSYAIEVSSGKACILDLSSGSFIKEVESIDKLIEAALTLAL